MAAKRVDDETFAAVWRSSASVREVAARLGMDERAVRRRRDRLEKKWGTKLFHERPAFRVDKPPSDVDLDELLQRRRAQWERTRARAEAAELIPVEVKLDGPIGIAHIGDPHLDDDGCDFPTLEKHITLIRETDGMFAGNVGDVINNWLGRHARLYALQSTSAREAWTLATWFFRSIPWLYLIAGNHLLWSGEGDPVRWITENLPGVYQPHNVRLRLIFPNGREVRINARHDFHGWSQWNTAHGPAKAFMLGYKDHILVAGHRHITGYNILKDPATGLVGHAIRVGSYKRVDPYAHGELNLLDMNASPCVITVIDPYAEDEVDLVSVDFSVRRGCERLTWLRERWKRERRHKRHG